MNNQRKCYFCNAMWQGLSQHNLGTRESSTEAVIC